MTEIKTNQRPRPRNLIDNAVNYTPTGSIIVSLKNENGKLVFAVKDSGVGITKEDKEPLFAAAQ